MSDFTLSLNEETCIRCEKCVKVCPISIFKRMEMASGLKIVAKGVVNCIKCGHCAAVCPVSAIEHSLFPDEKIHKIEREKLPTPDQIEMLLKSRRSNRAFSAEPVPIDLLNRILEAAHRAPTASNLQQIEFTLITNKEKMLDVSRFTLGVFGKLYEMVNNPSVKPMLKMTNSALIGYAEKSRVMISEFERGNDMILRGAKALILIHGPKDNNFGRDDANLAYQNGSLMAECLGVSQFYTGFVCAASRYDKSNALAKMFEIDGEIYAGMALGMPSFKYSNYIDKKELSVKMIM